MHILFYILIFLFSFNFCKSQNLIPNGDFEDGPDSSSQGWMNWMPNCNYTGIFVDGPDDWTVVSGSPDRMVEGSIPLCNWDNDSAYSGNSYCVFGGASNSSEEGMAMLVISIQKGHQYNLHYCASRQTCQGFFTSPSRVEFIFDGGDTIISPFIGSTQWNCFDIIFSAPVISNSINIRGVGTWGATNVDNVSLEEVVSSGIQTEFPSEQHVKLYPNPVNDLLIIESNTNENSEFIIYDTAFQKLFQVKFSGSVSIGTGQLSKGIYLYKVLNKGGANYGKIVKQ